MEIPFEPQLFGYNINVHLVLEYLAFFIAFRYYVFLRRKSTDVISSNNRLSIILGAALGALIGSRLVGFLENPMIEFSQENIIQLLNTKTIMGGLFGGLLGVEFAKKRIGETESSGDLFTFPVILGIFIGRVGCFLSGINEFTYGKQTTTFLGMDLGDGLLRHPTSLYELVFLVVLFISLKHVQKTEKLKNGDLFKWFMILYFSFRFFIEFLKPNVFYVFGLSVIQILCIICLLYYRNTIVKAKFS
ncbi:prolipoprotein diacylglyceryl transferase [Algibacter amylolyticus]|uniref:Prolipoprotein diacylglyceryl transferase n=1 Tax=Algibacter amylolyticus TaxID=1608400 RepID=A0A5M7BDI9_9FLAO|nr:prolipoprotein diacylglyceryl transferase family protein [Algibacter amylolyticus]KAA5827489.1 prolipoprotein diacylglyceryl transferase [Algibacter amylolyticus]MBB5266688.1 prolipoprotein diacylglyceryltransferase [Algibacter amylolyticus]TSJ81734.1 prolipoprotein diacylglyceryl transferase [Algibacter amylolyticus]